MSSFRALLAAATVLAGVSGVIPAQADDTLTSPRVPPDPTLDQVESNVPDLANPLNKPITGGSEQPLVVGTEPPPSLRRCRPLGRATTRATVWSRAGPTWSAPQP